MGDVVHTMTYYEEIDEDPGLPPVMTSGPGQKIWSDLGVKPPPLRPLRYCDFRVEDGMCLRFSSLELDAMTFCTYHHQEVSMALAEEEKRIS